MKQLLINIGLVLFCSLGVLNSSYGQTEDEQLAAQFLAEEEFDKASKLYQRLHRQQPGSIYIYENYFTSLVETERFRDAEKMVEKQIKRYSNVFTYKVDLGYLYSLQKQEKKAKEYYDKLIKKFAGTINGASQLSQAFLKRQLNNEAIASYKHCRKSSGSKTLFWQNIMRLHLNAGNNKEFISEGLRVLQDQPRNLPVIKNFFSQVMDDEKMRDDIQSQTIDFIQAHPENDAYDQLLMWIYVQGKKFRSAYRQSVSMDKRLKENGRRLIELAQTCIRHENYEVAGMCFDYVIEKGEGEIYYLDARTGKLNTAYLAINKDPRHSAESVNNLISEYRSFISQYGESQGTSMSMMRLSELLIFHAKDINGGIAVLESLIAINRIDRKLLGRAKLLLGDAYLIGGNIWDSQLTYGQVDKAFKEEPLGQEAKFRNARLSYFKGDFDWAKSQLDVLKTATTQLISNNAIDLSLLILDNTGLDSTPEAMKEYANADFLLFQNKTDSCLQALNMLPFKYPNHSLEDEIIFLKARVKEHEKDYDEAVKFYEQIASDYAFDILADNAIFRLAEIQEEIYENPSKAIALYERIILEYSSSLYVVEARKRYLNLKEQIQ